jgi:single-stranded-DNA-specific exonuclease
MGLDTADFAFLGVEQSLTGRRWIGPTQDVSRHADGLVQRTGLPQALCQVLARLNVPEAETAAYLEPKLRDLMPDPRSLRDMEPAAARLVASARTRERVAIFADYDVDGGTSAALLLNWYRHFGIEATLYVPDRIDEGYGPNDEAMSALAAKHDLIICVDCGTLSHGPIAAAKGADVVVLDHHLGGETLPDAFAIVNPNRQDETGDLAHLCAAAVVFLALVEAGRQLRADKQSGPDLMGYLDLVALATVADVAPLVGVNRAFVHQGLKIMSQRARPGLAALCDTARLDSAPEAYHLGYVLGPRINAGGRVGQADLGARLLASSERHQADAYAERLEALNAERRAIEEAVRAQALAQAEERGFDAPLVWAAGEGWHPGVVGIVASRLKEAANRPAIVIGLEDGMGKGSGRSVSGIDLGASIQRLAREGLLEKVAGTRWRRD